MGFDVRVNGSDYDLKLRWAITMGAFWSKENPDLRCCFGAIFCRIFGYFAPN
jgi:hypothetical protein